MLDELSGFCAGNQIGIAFVYYFSAVEYFGVLSQL